MNSNANGAFSLTTQCYCELYFRNRKLWVKLPGHGRVTILQIAWYYSRSKRSDRVQLSFSPILLIFIQIFLSHCTNHPSPPRCSSMSLSTSLSRQHHVSPSIPKKKKKKTATTYLAFIIGSARGGEVGAWPQCAWHHCLGHRSGSI